MRIGDKPKYDFYTIFIFLGLITIGWLAIYSSVNVETYSSIWDMNVEYGKQFIWIALALLLIVIILAIEPKFYERFAGVIYVVSMLSLLGLFVFGKEISGARSWYSFGSVGLQPSDFAKFATALAVAKYLSQLNVTLKNKKHLLIVGGIILLPPLLIIPQPDPGSALVYSAFFFTLYREGLSLWFLTLGLLAVGLFVGALAIGPIVVSISVLVVVVVMYLLSRKRKHKKRLAPPRKWLYIITAFLAIGYTFSTQFVFENVLSDRHRNRIDIILGRVEDNKGIGYNLNQSLITIGHGGWTGTGLLKGSQTQGGYVPEQHTDFVFTAIAEELGFVGASAVVLLFMALIYRLVIMAERQRNQFARVYGYGVAGIFTIHFFVNIGMVLGLLPTVGIPLPFVSYGGSGLWGFTVLLFVFVKLDAHRMSYDH